MATEIKIWQIAGKGLRVVEDTRLASQHLESDLETWIAEAPDTLGNDLLVIDRQRNIPDVGRLDLLCIDATGELVVVELKRDKSAREVVAQALDYASWLNEADAETILANSTDFLHENLADVFQRHFGLEEMPKIIPQNHRLIVVASRIDSSTERIINYLRERHGVKFNVLLFKYARLTSGEEILVRTVLLPEATRKPVGGGGQPTADDLMGAARTRNIEELVDICRRVRENWEEQARNTFGGSFRYWAARSGGGSRMVFGVNVSGKLNNAPAGKLDVWVRPPALSEVTGVSEDTIRTELQGKYSAASGGGQDYSYMIRLTAQDEAERLVAQLREWANNKPR